MEMENEHSIAIQLRACGHFLYYQTGGKAGQRRILVTILKHESLTQKELQDILDISSGALSEILQKMEDSELICRQKTHCDKRQITLSLTPKGVERAQRTRAHYVKTLDRMFECLSTEEKSKLGEILTKLVGHLDHLKTDQILENDWNEDD